MRKHISFVDKRLFPDCCVTCQEICVEDGCLVCNRDGLDILPYYICDEFKRLQSYGKYGKNQEDKKS